MLTWGWRVPFLCAFATALLGAALRRNMPEPHAFLTAARKARAGEKGMDVEAVTDDTKASLDTAPVSRDLEVEVDTNGSGTGKVSSQELFGGREGARNAYGF